MMAHLFFLWELSDNSLAKFVYFLINSFYFCNHAQLLDVKLCAIFLHIIQKILD
jgi:hypothetical protein